MTSQRNEVNAFRTILLRCAILVTGLGFVAGCASDERQAERLHRLALEELDEGKNEEAAAHLREILERYPDTEAAGEARDRLTLVQGLQEAVEKYPRRRTQDAMVQIGRALERFRGRKRHYPLSLDELVPAYLPDGVPSDGWGRAFDYEAKRGGRGYRMTSHGADGTPGGKDDARDVVVVDGEFVSGNEP
jgi:hypothetical protein